MGKFQAVSVAELKGKRRLKPEDQAKFDELRGYVEGLAKGQAGIYECDAGEDPKKVRNLLRKVAAAASNPLRIQLEGSRVIFLPKAEATVVRRRRAGEQTPARDVRARYLRIIQDVLDGCRAVRLAYSHDAGADGNPGIPRNGPPPGGPFCFLPTGHGLAPPGRGLDAHGCHQDRKAGGYHCHRGPLAGQSFASKAAMLRRLEATGGASAAPKGNAPSVVSVVRVIDGDTIRVCCLAGREESIRYIGVNTPEVHHPTKGEEPGGREATAVNRELVEGRQVRLEIDVQERDRHGRVLAYVWVDQGGEAVMVNAELVRRGYAQVMTIPPNVRHQELFLKLQREAREAGRGLWAK